MATDRRVLLDIGQEFAGYRVEAYIARGGMAVVYRARDLALSRPVALKLIAPELAENATFRARFVRESELAASIDHPNVIPVYRAGEHEGALYIAMRFVDGEDLGGLLRRRGRLAPEDALPLLTAVAGALDTAHDRGLVHRDVKPGNILIAGPDQPDAERHVYLTDFGLTKRSASLSGLTTAGHFLGTIAYVAPEQIANEAVDGRADLYSLGCVFFECLAGRLPFQRDDDAALLWAHVAEPPPPISQVAPGLPVAVDAVLARALAKRPDERPSSCRQLMAEFRLAFQQRPGPDVASAAPRPSVVRPLHPPVTSTGERDAGPPAAPTAPAARSSTTDGGSSPAPRPLRRPPRRRWVLGAAIVAVLALAAAVALFLTSRRGDDLEAWATYEGSSQNAPYRVEHPTAWLEHPDRQGLMIAPRHLVALFTTGDRAAWEVAQSHPGDVEGVMLSQAIETLPLTSADDVRAVVSAAPAFQQQLPEPVRVPIGGVEGWRLSGVLSAPDGAGTLQIAYEYYVASVAGGTAQVIFFSLRDRVDTLKPTFERMRSSLVLAPQRVRAASAAS